MAPPVLQWTYDINAKSKKHVGQKNLILKKSSNFEDKQYADIPKKTKLCSMITSTNYNEKYFYIKLINYLKRSF